MALPSFDQFLTRLRGVWRKPCGFKSRLSHQRCRADKRLRTLVDGSAWQRRGLFSHPDGWGFVRHTWRAAGRECHRSEAEGRVHATQWSLRSGWPNAAIARSSCPVRSRAPCAKTLRPSVRQPNAPPSDEGISPPRSCVCANRDAASVPWPWVWSPRAERHSRARPYNASCRQRSEGKARAPEPVFAGLQRHKVSQSSAAR